jgi:hypothetical protein
MVQAIRDGEPIRAVAKRFRVSVGAVSFWVKRCTGKRLDRCGFEDRASGPRTPWNRTPRRVERRIVRIRKELKQHSVLGEFGAAAIRHELMVRGDAHVPSPATIGRILRRHGQTDERVRIRRPAPPPGWYLPTVARGEAELDSFDFIEELKLKDGPIFSVLTANSLHGHRIDAWPQPVIHALHVVQLLLRRWNALGLPQFAQFDNDTRFQGAHQFADTVGRVSRLCLALGVIPVFAPPREHGFQNLIESLNGLWQLKVWQRFHFSTMPQLRAHSNRYTNAHRQRSAGRCEHAPGRSPFPRDWKFDISQPLRGTLIYLRRTDAKGQTDVLGHRFNIDRLWVHRLVRCEVLFDDHLINCFALRRRDPEHQPLLASIPYEHPNQPFRGEL